MAQVNNRSSEYHSEMTSQTGHSLSIGTAATSVDIKSTTQTSLGGRKRHNAQGEPTDLARSSLRSVVGTEIASIRLHFAICERVHVRPAIQDELTASYGFVRIGDWRSGRRVGKALTGATAAASRITPTLQAGGAIR
jgi:hypothetical protein